MVGGMVAGWVSGCERHRILARLVTGGSRTRQTRTAARRQSVGRRASIQLRTQAPPTMISSEYPSGDGGSTCS